MQPIDTIAPNIDLGFVAAGALVGSLLGLTGVGGGAIMTPILLIYLE